MSDPHRLRAPSVPSAPSVSPDALAREERVLFELRERLKSARERRGACPPWEELKADLLPGGGSRDGREARLAHRAECPYCDAHVLEWERSLDRTADALEAVEKGIARGILHGAQRLAGRIGGRRSPRAETAAEPEPVLEPPVAPKHTYEPDPGRAYEPGSMHPSAPAPSLSPPPPAPPPPTPPPPAPLAPPPPAAPPVSQPVAPRPSERPAPEPPVPSAAARPMPPPPAEADVSTRMLVAQIPVGVNAPESIFLCADVLEASVVMIRDIEELEGDPDLADVCGLVILSHLDPGDWPKLLRRARALVPRRPVVLMSLFGQVPTAAARRALGSSLLEASDPAERLLLALDPDLR